MNAKIESSVYWNSRVRGVTPYVPGEQPMGQKFIKLNTNENPYPPSPSVLDAFRRLSKGGDRLRLYPDPNCRNLRCVIAAWHGVRSTAEVFIGNGSDEILAFAFAAFFEADSTRPVLFPDVTYSFYPVYAALWDVPFCEIPLSEDWRINPRDYERPSGGVVIANPNAPTGGLLPESDILAIAEAAARYNAVTIVDEAYSEFSEESESVSSRRPANLLTVHTYSKAFSLAGMRVGYAIGNPELITALERIRDSFNSYTVGCAAQSAAIAAMSDYGYFAETRTTIINTRERVSETLRARSYTVLPSAANFLFIRHPTLDGAAFFKRLREKGILVRRFTGPRVKDFLRVSIGTDSDMDAFLAAAEC